jgi:hypothetical protein
MKRFTTLSIAAIVLFAAGGAGLAVDGASRVRLIYHSDTQGYYRPCG